MNSRWLALPLLWLLALPALAADWPQYRGPDRTDLSQETGLLKEWPKGGPPLRWTYGNTGIGCGGPAIVGERLYIMGGRGDEEFVIALDLKAVKEKAPTEVWAAKIGPTFAWKNNNWNAGPSATPTVDGDLLYAQGGQGVLLCVETASGKERWRKDLAKDLDGEVNPIGGGPAKLGWGYTMSPLVDGDKLITIPGGPKGTVAALNKQTGAVLWRSAELKDQAAYTSPVLATLHGVRQYVVLTNGGLSGIDAADGKLLWSWKRMPRYSTEVVNTPLIHENLVYASVGAGNSCDLIKVVAEDKKFAVEPVYTSKALLNHHGGVLLKDGHVFGNSQSRWVCQNLLDGKVAWEDKKLPSGSITYADGHLYCYTEGNGTAALVEASTQGWTEKGRLQIPQQSALRKERLQRGQIWTPPVVANGQLFLRDHELLFCFDVQARP